MNRLWRLASPGAMLALLMLAGFGGPLVFRLYFHHASADWERVPAEVEKIVEQPKSAILHYHYSHEGQNYRGKRFQYLSAGSIPEKTEILGYHLGDPLVILMDPQQPDRSVVKRAPLQPSQVLPSLLMMGIGAAILVWSWRKDKSDGL